MDLIKRIKQIFNIEKPKKNVKITNRTEVINTILDMVDSIVVNEEQNSIIINTNKNLVLNNDGHSIFYNSGMQVHIGKQIHLNPEFKIDGDFTEFDSLEENLKKSITLQLP